MLVETVLKIVQSLTSIQLHVRIRGRVWDGRKLWWMWLLVAGRKLMD